MIRPQTNRLKENISILNFYLKNIQRPYFNLPLILKKTKNWNQNVMNFEKKIYKEMFEKFLKEKKKMGELLEHLVEYNFIDETEAVEMMNCQHKRKFGGYWEKIVFGELKNLIEFKLGMHD
jgi:hypothetical protein